MKKLLKKHAYFQMVPALEARCKELTKALSETKQNPLARLVTKTVADRSKYVEDMLRMKGPVFDAKVASNTFAERIKDVTDQ